MTVRTTTIRMDEELKRQATEKLEALGLNFNTYVVMATKQLVAQNRVPFDLIVPGNPAAEDLPDGGKRP